MDITIDASEQVRTFIREQVLIDEGNLVLDDTTPLLQGILDSLALMQLVDFLESEFEIEIDNADITKEHFSTIAAIKSLVVARAEQG